MQSCKPLPCGIGSWQNRRPREQTLTRKPCHCGSIKGGWLPTSLDQPLQGQIICACLYMFLLVWDLCLLPKREPLVTCKSQRHFKTICWQLPWNVQLYETPYWIGRRPGYQGPRCKDEKTADKCTMERQDSPRPRSSRLIRKTYGTSSSGTCQIQHRHRSPMLNIGGSLNDLEYFSSGVAHPKEKERRPE